VEALTGALPRSRGARRPHMARSCPRSGPHPALPQRGNAGELGLPPPVGGGLGWGPPRPAQPRRVAGWLRPASGAHLVRTPVRGRRGLVWAAGMSGLTRKCDATVPNACLWPFGGLSKGQRHACGPLARRLAPRCGLRSPRPARSPPSSTSTPGVGLDAGRVTPAAPHDQWAASARPPPQPSPNGGREP
jgi:hypothetical protein